MASLRRRLTTIGVALSCVYFLPRPSLYVTNVAATDTAPLPPHTVSGFSSGGYMAANHLITLSASAKRAAILAGYPVADGAKAATLKSMAARGLIDSIDHLRDAAVYIYRGQNDTLVQSWMARAVAWQMGQLMPRTSVYMHIEPGAPHGILVTGDPQAHACDHQGPPFINDCGNGVDLFARVFPFVLNVPALPKGPNGLRPARHDPLRIFLLEQAPFVQAAALGLSEEHIASRLGDSAMVYVPTGCGEAAAAAAEETRCSIHVDYHGCFMSDEVDHVPAVPESRAMHLQYYLQHTAQYDYAEAYRTIVLNPRVADTPHGNWGACWRTPPMKDAAEFSAVRGMLAFLGAHVADGTLVDALWARHTRVGEDDRQIHKTSELADYPNTPTWEELSESLRPERLSERVEEVRRSRDERL